MTLAAMLILAMLVGPMLFVETAEAWTDPAAWYKTVPGVLATDYYSLYPYETDASIKIGFSQFGEMIDSVTNVGLEYRSVDPFAPVAGPATIPAIPKKNWINGWLMNITYVGLGGEKRCVWASALHADFKDFGGPWLRVDFANDWDATYRFEDPMDPGYQIGNYAAGTKWGGRKTNGTAVTDPIQVLYHGPRKFVALLTTTIYDHPAYLSDDPAVDIPLVKVMFTIIFDKVKKSVVILKDVKSIAPKLILVGKMNVQLSDRGELDLGTAALGFDSYAHFYTAGNGEGQYTVYDRDWEDRVITEVPQDDPETPEIEGKTGSGPYPQEGDSSATYDVAQIINPATENVLFAAFWPSLSDWDIFGGPLWWRSLTAADPHNVDIPSPTPGEPFTTPFYIGEWDFELTDTLGKDLEFRGVTVYGLTDLHDADDADWWYDNIIDTEARYQLDEVFNPWDLMKAVSKKDTFRVVNFFEGDGDTADFWLYHTFPIPAYPVFDYEFRWTSDEEWDDYCVFSERVLVDGVLQIRDWDYDVHSWYDEYYDEYLVYIYFYDAPADGAEIKVLFSLINHEALGWWNGMYEWIVVGRDSKAVDSAGAAMVSEFFDLPWRNVGVRMSGLDMQDPDFGPEIPYVFSPLRPALLPNRNAYRDATWGPNTGRAALLDDWCTTVPVSSSNIIGVGGFWANHLLEYLNDFTDGYYDPTSDEIETISCWSKNSYSPVFVGGVQTVGYGVITVYKDLNGTAYFGVWGYTGQDTYYTTWFLWNSGIDLWGMPPGITTLILEFDYTVHPAESGFVTLVEALGTISEYNEGYIHVDP